MKGRTDFNYGIGKILKPSEIEYMMSIVDSDLSDQDKAIKLYSFCNTANMLYNGFLHDSRIKQLVRIYKEYEEQGLFDICTNPYKCTYEEMIDRLEKLKMAYEIIHSDKKDYEKATDLVSIFKDAETFRKMYSLFIKFGQNDERLDSARVALNEYDFLLNTFREYENNGLVDNINYVNNMEEHLKKYYYAEGVISRYISQEDSYREYEFLSSLGIDKKEFEFCVSAIQVNDELYQKYLEKKEMNKTLRYVSNLETVKNLANGIRYGILSDGSRFNFQEFIKRVPFKRNKHFLYTITEFVRKNDPADFRIIMEYIHANGLNKPSALKGLDFKELYSGKVTVRGVEIKREDVDNIIDYMKVNDIPLIKRAYLYVRDMYISGLINNEEVKRLKEIKERSAKGKQLDVIDELERLKQLEGPEEYEEAKKSVGAILQKTR